MPRAITVVAISLGGVIGAVTALLSMPMSKHNAESRTRAPNPANSEPAQAVTAAALTSVPSEPASSGAPKAGPREEEAFGADAIAAAKLHCSWGAPGDCLHVARAYLHEDPNDAKHARPYQQLAVSLYARECKARDPVACRALSQLYAAGEGVSPSPLQARALSLRTLDLCRVDPAPACAALLRPAEGH